jgi:D-alanyl-D-alanine dipeptidase
VVRGLTDQLLGEIACLSPDALGNIASIPNLELDVDVLPVVQKPVVQALTDAAAANGKAMKITSALRTLPQQYLLHRWASRKRCGVTLAANVGESNHEQGLAVDISTSGGSAANKKIRASMKDHQFTWLGADDPVHFDYNGGAGVDLAGLSTRAFQRLWNRNHPEAPLDENGVYDAKVEKKLVASPAAGFPIGARCD